MVAQPAIHAQPTYAELLLIIERLKAENKRLSMQVKRDQGYRAELEQWRYFGRVFDVTYEQRAGKFNDTNKKIIVLLVRMIQSGDYPTTEDGLIRITERDVKGRGGFSDKTRIHVQSVLDRHLFISEGIEVDQQEGAIWNLGLLSLDSLIRLIKNAPRANAYRPGKKKYCRTHGYVPPKYRVTSISEPMCSVPGVYRTLI
jgi:hypothetical protein